MALVKRREPDRGILASPPSVLLTGTTVFFFFRCPSIVFGAHLSSSDRLPRALAIRSEYGMVTGTHAGRNVRHKWQAKAKTCLVRYSSARVLP